MSDTEVRHKCDRCGAMVPASKVLSHIRSHLSPSPDRSCVGEGTRHA